MDLRDTVIRILQSEGRQAALEALRTAAGSAARAAWLAPDGTRLAAAPEGGPALDPVVLPAEAACGVPFIHPEGPEGFATLVLPLTGAAPRAGDTVMLAAPPEAIGTAGAWAQAAGALERVRSREDARRAVEVERDTLQRRAEESEALHVLGMAAFRTLDTGEVLQMVARFTRTVLGAHYVTVSATEEGRIQTLAWAGLRAGEGAGVDPFAERVARAGRPLVLQPDDGGRVSEPFHAAEGMRVGLGVPLALFGETFGALVVGYRRPFQVTPGDERLALTLAGHAAVALSNARLHTALAERSRELERANEELRWSAAAKDRFFASVSHELRTPLNAILGYNSLLLEGVVGEVAPGARAFLQRARRATENLLYLVNDVLDLSKMEAGKLELVMQSFDPLEVVDEALATVEPLAREKSLPLAVTPGVSLPRIAGDPDRVRQILVNLLSNAIKFTDTGTVSLVLGTVEGVEEEGERRRWVEMRVSDTGPGIESVDQERIFHEFEQVSGAGVRGGTGLGLPISRKLARLLGGELRIESAPGRGSTFILRLPADG